MKTVQAMLAEADAEVPRISPDEAKGLLGRADVLFLDVREPAEVTASGKVPGAVAIPRGLVEFKADPASAMHDKAFDRTKMVVAYCASGGRSALVGKTLKDMGLRQRTQSRRLQRLVGRRRRRRKGLRRKPTFAGDRASRRSLQPSSHMVFARWTCPAPAAIH
ncbi:rhodanese-related sulfurtransferase [Bradyrhizobium sp. AZCC 1588]